MFTTGLLFCGEELGFVVLAFPWPELSDGGKSLLLPVPPTGGVDETGWLVGDVLGALLAEGSVEGAGEPVGALLVVGAAEGTAEVLGFEDGTAEGIIEGWILGFGTSLSA